MEGSSTRAGASSVAAEAHLWRIEATVSRPPFPRYCRDRRRDSGSRDATESADTSTRKRRRKTKNATTKQQPEASQRNFFCTVGIRRHNTRASSPDTACIEERSPTPVPTPTFYTFGRWQPRINNKTYVLGPFHHRPITFSSLSYVHPSTSNISPSITSFALCPSASLAHDSTWAQ